MQGVPVSGRSARRLRTSQWPRKHPIPAQIVLTAPGGRRQAADVILPEVRSTEGKPLPLMTSRVYTIGLQGLEPPVPPAALAAGASREERVSYSEFLSRHRGQVREFCNSLAAELTGTDRRPLRSYLHTAQDGTPQLRLSVFEIGSDAAAAVEKAGAELLYTEDLEPSVDRQTLRIPATFQHQTVGQGLTLRHQLRRTPTETQQARWEAVQQTGEQGLSLRDIARKLGMARDTAGKYAKAESPPTKKRSARERTKAKALAASQTATD